MKKLLTCIAAGLLVIGAAAGCGGATVEGYQKISPQKAHEMMQTEQVVIVDVRQPSEYADGHVPGAILLPDDTIAKEAETVLPDKNAVLLVYCRSGRRSKAAAEHLIRLGYKRVYDFGGILDWPYETV